MSAEMAQKLVQGGIKAVRSGDFDLARKAFTQALKLDPNNEAAWLGMATITEADTDKIRILNKVLEINPENERAIEAVCRLAGDSEPVDEVESPEPEDMPMESAESEVESDGVEEVARTTGEIKPLRDMPSGDTGRLSDFPEREWAIDEDVAGVDDAPEAEPVKDRTPTLVVRSSEAVFEAMPTLPARGQGGIPVPDREAVKTIASETDESVQAYLEASLVDYLTPETQWTRKTGRRAGSGEYRNFLLQAGAASFVGLLILMTALVAFLLTNATTRRILLAPTTIPSATPTHTPTATPGVTNTSSPTPLTPATETPELPSSAQLGNPDPNFPPQPTEIYYPMEADSLLDDALIFMEDGDLDAARDLIDDVVAIEQDTGEFPPIYRLSQWYLLNEDPEMARQIIEEWQEQFETNSSLFDRSQSLMLIAYAAVDTYEARNGLGDRIALLNTALDRLESSLGLVEGDAQIISVDRVNVDGYLLLAENYLLRGNSDEALNVLETGLDATFDQDDIDLFGDTQLRMAKVRILADDERYPEAFQELYFVLQFNPFLEEALILQAELALETEQAGLGVLYSQQYLLYYPGSLQGFYLLGQAREAESKFDLALNAYSRAVSGDTDDENYTSDPFFLENLLARADLLIQQGRRDLAATDFSLALELTDNNPAIRVRRLEASYAAGNYEDVLTDVEELLGEGELPQGQVLYYQGLALVDLAQAGEGANNNYDIAIDALDQALSLGLPSDLRPTAQEYLAIANLEDRRFGDALDAINDALEDGVTANRLYLRGLIFEGQGSISDALLDYEFIVTWGQYYAFPFYDDARERYDNALSRVGR